MAKNIELKALLEETAELPVTLAGHSWGACLGFIFAARHPHMVKKLILISSGGFEEKYAALTQGTRLSRLSDADRGEDFRSILLAKCGHKPWIERQARDRFFALLEKEL